MGNLVGRLAGHARMGILDGNTGNSKTCYQYRFIWPEWLLKSPPVFREKWVNFSQKPFLIQSTGRNFDRKSQFVTLVITNSIDFVHESGRGTRMRTEEIPDAVRAEQMRGRERTFRARRIWGPCRNRFCAERPGGPVRRPSGRRRDQAGNQTSGLRSEPAVLGKLPGWQAKGSCHHSRRWMRKTMPVGNHGRQS